LNEIRNMVLRIRELAVQMANGIYEDTPDRDNAQLEVAALLEQVDLIAENTKFNDVAVIDGTFTSVNIQAGNTTAETIELSFVDLGPNRIAINGANVGTQASASCYGNHGHCTPNNFTEQAKFGSFKTD
jgi:flagellin